MGRSHVWWDAVVARATASGVANGEAESLHLPLAEVVVQVDLLAGRGRRTGKWKVFLVFVRPFSTSVFRQGCLGVVAPGVYILMVMGRQQMKHQDNFRD